MLIDDAISRFADLAHAAHVREQRPIYARLTSLLRRAVPIEADGVADYLELQEEWPALDDIPTWAPPWPCMFIELRTPRTMQLVIDSIPDDLRLHRTTKRIAKIGVLLDYEAITAPPTGGGWRLCILGVSRTSLGEVYPYPWWCNIAVQPDGCSASEQPGLAAVFPWESEQLNELHALRPDVSSVLTDWHVPIAGLAVAFMHCKNVEMVLHVPEPALQRARLRRGKPPLVATRELVIRPIREVLRVRHDVSEPTRRLQRVHLARGHFKDYREGGGLFGCHHGLWFWNMYVRGNVQAGVVQRQVRLIPEVSKGSQPPSAKAGSLRRPTFMTNVGAGPLDRMRTT